MCPNFRVWFEENTNKTQPAKKIQTNRLRLSTLLSKSYIIKAWLCVFVSNQHVYAEESSFQSISSNSLLWKQLRDLQRECACAVPTSDLKTCLTAKFVGIRHCAVALFLPVPKSCTDLDREVGGWGRDPFSRNFMKPTPRRKWYLTTGRRFH